MSPEARAPGLTRGEAGTADDEVAGGARQPPTGAPPATEGRDEMEKTIEGQEGTPEAVELNPAMLDQVAGGAGMGIDANG